MPPAPSPRNRYVLLALTAVGLALCLFPSSASAAHTLYLAVPNDGIDSYQGPYGKVDITLTDSTHASITLTALNNGGYYYRFGSNGALGLNFNGGATLNSITELEGPGSLQNPTFGGAANENGFGQFNFTLDNFDGAGYAFTKLTFTVTKNSAGSWSSDTNVLAPNAGGWLAAGHVFVFSSQTGMSGPGLNGTVPTGYAANGEAILTPAPPSALLALFGVAGFGLVGLVRLVRRPAPALVA